MTIIEWVVAALLVAALIVLLLIMGSSHAIQRHVWLRWSAEHPTPTANVQPPTGAELKSYTDQTYTIPGETTQRWKVGDEIVAVTTELGTVVISKDYADRMGIDGTPGKVVEG